MLNDNPRSMTNHCKQHNICYPIGTKNFKSIDIEPSLKKKCVNNENLTSLNSSFYQMLKRCTVTGIKDFADFMKKLYFILEKRIIIIFNCSHRTGRRIGYLRDFCNRYLLWTILIRKSGRLRLKPFHNNFLVAKKSGFFDLSDRIVNL